MDGGQSLPPIKRQLAQALIENGAKPQYVAEEVGCSVATVYHYKENIQLFGHTLAPSISRIERPPDLTMEMLDVCSFTSLFISKY